MATPVGNVSVAVGADISEYLAAMRRTAQATESLSSSFMRAAESVKGFGLAAAAAIGVYEGLHSIIENSDAWTKFSNKLHVVTDDFGTFNASQQAVYDLAQKVRVPLEDASGAYTRLQTSVNGMGFSQSEVLKVTQGLITSFKSFGQSGQEASATVLQLSQALGKGKLDGDELRSVMEASMPVADAIAKQFGVTRGQLKDMGEQGKLLSSEVFKGMLNAADGFIETGKKVAPTFQDGFDTLKNAAVRAEGTFIEFTGLPKAMGGAMDNLAHKFDGFTESVKSGQFGTLTNLLKKQWSDLCGEEIPKDLDFLAKKAGETADSIGNYFSKNWHKFLPDVKAVIQTDAVEIAHFLESFLPNVAATAVFEADAQMGAALVKQGKAKSDSTQQTKQEVLDAIWAERDAAIQAAEKEIEVGRAKLAEFKKQQEEKKKELDKPTPKTGKVGFFLDRDDNAQGDLEEMTLQIGKEMDKRVDDLIKKGHGFSVATMDETTRLNDFEIENIRSRYLIEVTEKEDHEKALLDIEKAHKQQAFENNAQYQQVIESENLRHLRAMQDQVRNGGNGITDLVGKQFGARYQLAVGSFADVLGALGQHNKAAFEASKLFGMADATVQMFGAIAKANNLPFPLNIAEMVRAGVMGVLQIQNISKTQFGGAASSATHAADASAAASAAASAPAAAAAPAPTQIMQVQGIDPNQWFSGSYLEKIGKNLTDFAKDGGTVQWGAA